MSVSEQEMQELYQSGFSVENVGFKTEESVGNIDLFKELQLMKWVDGIDWLDNVSFNGDDIKLDSKPIIFKVIGDKYKLFVRLAPKTKKVPEKTMEVKGKDKSSIILKWLAQSDHKTVLLSEGEWVQLLVVDLAMKISINKDGYCSVASYSAERAYYKQEKKVRFQLRHRGDEMLQKLMKQVESRHESAYTEVDASGRNEYDRQCIEEAINLLEEYGIDCTSVDKGFA